MCFSGATHANWYYYAATADTTIFISSCLGGADTRLSVYTGTCGALVCNAANDDNCSIGRGSELTLSVVTQHKTALFKTK